MTTAIICSIDLSGAGGGISEQVCGLTIGIFYSVSFALSERPGATVGGIVSVSTPGTAVKTITFTTDPVTTGDMEWQHVAYRFIATAK